MPTATDQRRPAVQVVALVPAAGQSRRMGTAKLLLPWGDGTVIDRTIRGWRQSCVRDVIVVVSPENEPLAEKCRRAGAVVVVPPSPPADMKTSLQHGIRFAIEQSGREKPDCFLVAPADMPWIEPAVIDRLVAEFAAEFAAAFAAGRAAIVAPKHEGRRGHPILLAWPLADELLRLGEHETLKTLVQRHRVHEVECNASILGDLDTPEDYQQARESRQA